MFSEYRPLLLLIASVSFGLGISLPLMTFEKLWVFTETPSLIDIIINLWKQKEFALASIITLFSILFPLLKLFSTHQAVLRGRLTASWTATLAKWSMMDVLLVAIAIFAAKTSGVANAVSQPGLWFYTLSAITVAIAAAGLRKR